MNKLFQILIFSIVLFILAGCGSELSSFEDGHHRKKQEKSSPVMKTIRMSFGGDFISESDEPLLRAEDGDTYVGINVFRTEKDKDGAKEEKYAYGLFKKKDGLSIDLLTGYLYKFEVSVLIENVDKVFNSGTGRIGAPFRIKNMKSSGASYFEKDDIGDFQYTDKINDDDNRNFLFELNSGMANVDAGDDIPSQYGDVWYPRVKRYYGTIPAFDPALEDEVSVNLNYICFGLKIELTNLPSGTVSIRDISDRENNSGNAIQHIAFPNGLKLSNERTEWEGLYSMYDLEGESETFTLRFTWNKGGSERETFESTFTVKPKMRKVLKLKITGTPNYTTKGNITLTMDSENLTDEEVEIVEQFK